MDPLIALAIGAAALLTAIVGGATGIGSAIAMIAVLTFAVGIREAVPIVTIAVTIQTVSRVWVNRAFIDYQVARWFILGALPAAALPVQAGSAQTSRGVYEARGDRGHGQLQHLVRQVRERAGQARQPPLALEGATLEESSL